MPSCFITFRAHPNDLVLFEDFLTIFIPLIKQRCENYLYVVEKDNTSEKHFHAVCSDKSFRDTDKCRKKFDCKPLQKFKKFITFNSESNLTHALQTHYIGQEDKEKNTDYYIGYCYKEDNLNRRDTNFSMEKVELALKYYHAMKRVDINAPRKVRIHVKPNTFDTYLDEFRAYEGDDFTYVNVFQRMVKAGYRFSSMTSKQVQLCLIEHRIERNEEDKYDKAVHTDHCTNNYEKSGITFELLEAVQTDLETAINKKKIDFTEISEQSKMLIFAKNSS